MPAFQLASATLSRTHLSGEVRDAMIPFTLPRPLGALSASDGCGSFGVDILMVRRLEGRA